MRNVHSLLSLRLLLKFGRASFCDCRNLCADSRCAAPPITFGRFASRLAYCAGHRAGRARDSFSPRPRRAWRDPANAHPTERTAKVPEHSPRTRTTSRPAHAEAARPALPPPGTHTPHFAPPADPTALRSHGRRTRPRKRTDCRGTSALVPLRAPERAAPRPTHRDGGRRAPSATHPPHRPSAGRPEPTNRGATRVSHPAPGLRDRTPKARAAPAPAERNAAKPAQTAEKHARPPARQSGPRRKRGRKGHASVITSSSPGKRAAKYFDTICGRPGKCASRRSPQVSRAAAPWPRCLS